MANIGNSPVKVAVGCMYQTGELQSVEPKSNPCVETVELFIHSESPCRWFKYSRFGTPIGETKIITVKTPLKKVCDMINCVCVSQTDVYENFQSSVGL